MSSILKWLIVPAVLVGGLALAAPQEAQAQSFGLHVGPGGSSFYYGSRGPRYSPYRYYAPRYDYYRYKSHYHYSPYHHHHHGHHYRHYHQHHHGHYHRGHGHRW